MAVLIKMVAMNQSLLLLRKLVHLLLVVLALKKAPPWLQLLLPLLKKPRPRMTKTRRKFVSCQSLCQPAIVFTKFMCSKHR